MKNQYFKVVYCLNDDKYDTFSCIHIKQDINVWHEICNKYLNTKEYAEMVQKDPYGSIYHFDLKEYIKSDFPEIYSFIAKSVIDENLDNPNIKVWLATSHDYGQINEQFSNDMKFVEDINSEISELDKNREITEELLISTKFENITQQNDYEYWKNSEYQISDFSAWRINTSKIDGDNHIVILLMKGITNNGAKWHVHIDNNACESIGCADISNVWQFNTLVNILGSKFRLQ